MPEAVLEMKKIKAQTRKLFQFTSADKVNILQSRCKEFLTDFLQKYDLQAYDVSVCHCHSILTFYSPYQLQRTMQWGSNVAWVEESDGWVG